MWIVDLPELGALTPTEQLWVIAQALEENGGPPAYVRTLRAVADRLEDLGWWLSEPLDRALERPLGAKLERPAAPGRGPPG